MYPPRTCVCLALLALGSLLVPPPARADPTVEPGLYVDGEWYPAESVVANLSGLVQFRVCIAKVGTPAPAAAYAVHSPDPNPQAAWHVDLGTFINSSSRNAWIYVSPVYHTPACRNGDWDAWCQIVYPEPPGGGGGDAVIGPGDGELATASAVSVMSWEPPGYGFPEGFPAADEGHNDIYAGPGGVTAKNLSVTDIRVVDPPSIAAEYGPFVLLTNPAPTTIVWEADMDDGFELPGDATTVGTLYLHPLSLGGALASSCDPTGLPPATQFSEQFADQPPGLYWWDLVGTESATGDGTKYTSDYLMVQDFTPTSFECTGPRRGVLHVSVTTTDQGQHLITQTAELWYHWALGLVPMNTLLLAPTWTNTTESCRTDDTAFDLAGTWHLAAAYEDQHGVRYHNGQNRWSNWPGSCALEIPADAIFVCVCDPLIGSQMAPLAEYRESLLHYLPDDPGNYAASFYSPHPPSGTRGGLVQCPTKANFMSALCEDEVISWMGHGGAGWLCLCTEQVQTQHVAALPAGAPNNARLIWLSSCCAFDEEANPNIGTAMVAKGAQCVFGYKWEVTVQCGGGAYFERKAWEYLRQGCTVWTAVVYALADTAAAGYNPVQWGLLDDPSTPNRHEGWYASNGDTTIAPAFQIP